MMARMVPFLALNSNEKGPAEFLYLIHSNSKLEELKEFKYK